MKQKQIGPVVLDFENSSAGKLQWHILNKRLKNGERLEDLIPTIANGSKIIAPPGVTVRPLFPVPELPVLKLDSISLSIPSRLGNIGAMNKGNR